jgi:DNA-binding response OmpR family regulator
MNSPTKKQRLLLIEDNSDTRQIYKDVFEREGFDVLSAEDGEEGLSYAQSTLPDVILLDLMLPKISGLDLLELLRSHEETKKLPVVIFSALGEASDRKRAAELGVTEYSVKALNSPKQVVSRVRALLSKEHPVAANGGSATMSAALKGTSFDAAKLQAQAGLKGGFLCPECHAEVVLSMLSDPTRSPGQWFVAHLVCSGCQKSF